MHDHQAHQHGHLELGPDPDTRRLTTALALIVALLVTEVVAGLLAHSLALIADAAHMLTDAAALGMSLVVIRLVARPSGGNLTFGLKRAEILSAQTNGWTLLVLAGLIVYGGIERLLTPPQPTGWVVVAVALVGIVVNLLATRELARANQESMNIRGSYVHLLTDLAAFVATAIAGLFVIWGFARADGIASLLIAGIMLYAAYGLLKDSGRVLLEAAPQGMDVAAIGRILAAFPEVSEVHDLHIWTIGSSLPALSAHVLVAPGADCHGIRFLLERLLVDDFAISHTTLQVDHTTKEKLLTLDGSTLSSKQV